MTHLEELAPRVEQYSIDEMFLDIRGINSCIDFEDFGRQLRVHVGNGTGLTIGVGMGPTKTLAKSAQWASKEWPQFGGVLALTPGNPRRTEKLLSLQPVEEIWGWAGEFRRRWGQWVSPLRCSWRANPTFIRKNFNVVLERTVRELNGEPCISLEEAPAKTADCLQPFFRRARHHLGDASGRLPACRTRSGEAARRAPVLPAYLGH
jgi:DNA polymerase V